MRFCHNRKCVSYKSGLSVVKYYRRTGDKVITKEKSFDGGQQEKMVMASLDYSSPNADGNYSNNH